MTNTTELPTPREVIIEAMAMEVEAAHEKHVIAYSINRVKTYGWKLPASSTGQESEPKSMDACIEASDAFDEVLRKQLQDAFELGQAAGQATDPQCLHQIQEPAPVLAAQPDAGNPATEPQAAPAAVAVADELAAFEDATWYWVEKEGWIGDPPTIAPALYKAEIDAWYSFAFSGIPTRQLKVLEPCLMKARAALAATPAADGYTEMLEESFGITDPAAAPVVPSELIEAVDAWFAQNTGLCGCSDKDVAELAAIFAEATQVTLPEPVAWRHSRTLTLHETEQEVQLADGDSHAEPLFTEQQVRALLAAAPAHPAEGVQADLYAAIMNIPVNKEKLEHLGINERLQYKIGHRDARYDAAELAAAHAAPAPADAPDLRATIMGTPLGVFGTGIGDIGIAYRAGHRAALLTAAERVAAQAAQGGEHG